MTLDVPRIKALCFDVDGTLSDTDDYYANKVAALLPRALFPDPVHTARRLVMWIESPGNALLGFADRVGIDDEMVAFIDWLNRHRKSPLKRYLIVPGVEEMLKLIQGRYPMAVVSARDEKSTMRFLTQFDLSKYFDPIVTGLSAPHTKPYPDPILLAAQKMGVRPEECLMIGDTTVDMRAGKAAGAQTLGVLCGFGEEHELRQLGADLILKSTSDLTEIFVQEKSLA
ncbi:MAG TPA: HAD family hydrolase [Anaerolineales bacterium]|nr:HAD family hydrolase [Anaerolineales bacterium]